MLVEADNAAVRGLTSPQRGRGHLTAATAPHVSLLSFSFCDLPQDGIREHTEVCPLRGAAVCWPVCATLHRDAEICHHCGKGQSVCAAPQRHQHSLLADRGLLNRLCHLHRPAGVGTPEVLGVYKKEVSCWEEEMVSFLLFLLFVVINLDQSAAQTGTRPVGVRQNRPVTVFKLM